MRRVKSAAVLVGIATAGSAALVGGCSSHPKLDQRAVALCAKFVADDNSMSVSDAVRTGGEPPELGGGVLVSTAGVLNTDASDAQADGFPDISQAGFTLSELVGNLATATQNQDPTAETDDLTKIAVARQTLTSACATDERKY